MGKTEDFIGRKFGKLTVINYDHTNDKGMTYWLCECDCRDHNRVVVSKKYLYDKNFTQSCGCSKRADLVGERFGYLRVLEFDHIAKGRAMWRCACERCGGEIIVSTTSLKTGNTISCGCYKREQLGERARTHGLTNHPLYVIWCGMKERCGCENGKSWRWYGGNGISVCDEWVHDFKAFFEWSINNGWKPGLSIDRCRSDEDYSPDNCRWVNKIIQANNTRNNRHITYAGETHTMARWAAILNKNYFTLRGRLDRGDMRDFENYFGFYDPNYVDTYHC